MKKIIEYSNLEGKLRDFVIESLEECTDTKKCIKTLAEKLYKEFEAKQCESFAEYCLFVAKQIFINPFLYSNLEDIRADF